MVSVAVERKLALWPQPGSARLVNVIVTRCLPVWDPRIAGLGVRVRPSGGRSWIFLRKTDGGTRRISLGPVELKTVEEVRERGQAGRDPPCCPVVPGLRRRHMERGLLRPLQAVNPKERAIHPCQATAARLRIETAGPHIPTRVRRWFDIYSRTAPGGANRALDLLRQIMNVAVACGHVDSNPARGVKRNRRPALTRFLSREEIGRLHRVRSGLLPPPPPYRLATYHPVPDGTGQDFNPVPTGVRIHSSCKARSCR